MLYHYTIGFPKQFTVPNKSLELYYSRHARQASISDQYGTIELPNKINLATTKIVEIEICDSTARVLKLVVRQNYSAALDLVLVVNPNGFVRTVWLNETQDTHKTLNRAKYSRP